MIVETEQTPNPETLKFLPGKEVSEIGPIEFTEKDFDLVQILKSGLILFIVWMSFVLMIFLEKGLPKLLYKFS